MNPRFGAALAVSPLLLILAGCAPVVTALEEPTQSPSTSPSDPEAGAGPSITYEFEPHSTASEVVGWPATGTSTAFYFVSEPVETQCHWIEASSLPGPEIADTIDLDQVDALEGLACGVSPTQLSERDDVIDEVAWRVDDGLGDLVAAYAATVFTEGELNCDPVEVPLDSPGLSVKYSDKWYVVRPAGLACPETVAQINQSVATLSLTEVLRHTTTFDEYIARGH
jgi:hypothetical protein